VRLPETRKGRIRLAIIAALAIGTVYFLVSRVIPHDDLQGLLEDISDTLGAWTYLLVGAFAFLETGAFVGLVVPGETTMLLGGAVAGQGAVDVYLLMAIAWFAAWAGDTTSFFIGRRLGRGFVLRHGPRFGISRERFERVEAYFDRHGGKTILIGRFISLVRALAPFVAGSSGMKYRAFVPYSVLGTGVWSIAHIIIGYVFSRSIDEAAKYAGRGFFILGTLIVTTVTVVLTVRWLRDPANRRKLVAALERRRPGRWALATARRLQPQARFFLNRVTPGGTLGLEFTTLFAILAVSLFVLTSYGVIISDAPGPTPGDDLARDAAADIRTGWGIDVADAVTQLGSRAVAWPLAILCALALGWRRHWPEMAVVLVGTLMIAIAVPNLKEAFDRPRPPGESFTYAAGDAYPSGHAAYSTLYLWLAITGVIRLRPGMARATLVFLGGLILTASIGLSRVYLNVHWMSDVSGGWALGASAFALCAVVALLVTQLRHDPAGERRGIPGAARGGDLD
jgi:undecaprenyl-diphosphatase